MDIVHLHLECTKEVAHTIMPLLLKARELAHQGACGWCCFYVPGQENFKLGNIETQLNGESCEFDTSDVIWQASAVFSYEIDEHRYEHSEPVVYLSDAAD